jgi:ADP-ribose pyrophosphatase YjhB (NUDIX family)
MPCAERRLACRHPHDSGAFNKLPRPVYNGWMTFNWLDSAQRLRAIAQTGLTYSKERFDRQRYDELTQMAEAMLAALLAQTPEIITRAFALHQGYPTPKVDVRTAVFSEGRILLVKEWFDGLWTMPGGWADELDSPSKAAERECVEESGYEVRVTRLVSVKDRRVHPYEPQHLGGVYKLFFLAEITGGEARTSDETTDVGFFARDELPPLSLSRTLAADIEQAWMHQNDPSRPTTFD